MTSRKKTADSPSLTAREEAAARRAAEHRRADLRRRNLIVGSVVVVVLILVALVGVTIQSARQSSTADSGGDPSGFTDGGVVLGEGPVTVTVYEDFLCPACKDFEERAGATLRELRDAGTITVEYRPIAILDRLSTDGYSTRAAAAAACAVDAGGPEAFSSLHDELFVRQPAEGGAGLDDALLGRLAAEAVTGSGGTDDGVAACVRSDGFEGWVADVTDQASQDGVRGTPTVLVDGIVVEDTTDAGLRAAVAAAG